MKQKIDYTFKEHGYTISASLCATQEFDPDKWKPSTKPGYMVATMKTDNAIIHIHRPILSDDEYIKRQKELAKATLRFLVAIEKERKRAGAHDAKTYGAELLERI